MLKLVKQLNLWSPFRGQGSFSEGRKIQGKVPGKYLAIFITLVFIVISDMEKKMFLEAQPVIF